MRITGQVIIDTKTGEIVLRTSSGTFESGSPLLAQIAAAMKARGVQLGDFTPEQHRHDDPDALERETHRQHAH